MMHKLFKVYSLFSLTLAVNILGGAAGDVFECPRIEEGSQQHVEITQFSYGELTVHLGDIPPRPSTADVSFFVTSSANGKQACSGTIVQQQNGEWQDADGLAWFKCGTESAPDPDCLDCTHFQFDWGHEGWHFAVNQTWACASSGGGSYSVSYKVSGSIILDPECTESPEISFRSCTAPDFPLSVDLYDQTALEALGTL
ncbi:uncharacterized protein GGS22DRAFT_191476 [Annulohypoxylon maeteangense]|uniref:uncharacterized protein n=1 Tax=Annulohypoxylon maeteangense TaxID=1927788 RepID=UPI00200894FF|nr:uncharacterized protein GGS22DRAFT_191476 [Annulohypoxylon maeteangense]KAI0882306.1 hypothetical protein GGS22DRAFT_191476 [Annulohypoxylon maeteangense]